MASVTVHFAFIIDGEGDEFDIVPDSQFTIKRTAQSDNKSNYYLDGKTSGYKEVTDRVKEIGIDLTTSRFLILQVLKHFAQFFLRYIFFRVRSSRFR